MNLPFIGEVRGLRGSENSKWVTTRSQKNISPKKQSPQLKLRKTKSNESKLNALGHQFTRLLRRQWMPALPVTFVFLCRAASRLVLDQRRRRIRKGVAPRSGRNSASYSSAFCAMYCDVVIRLTFHPSPRLSSRRFDTSSSRNVNRIGISDCLVWRFLFQTR